MLSIYGAEGCAPQTTPFTNFPEATHASDCQSHTPTTRLPTIQASEQWKRACLHALRALKSRGYANPSSFLPPLIRRALGSRSLLRIFLSLLLQKVGTQNGTTGDKQKSDTIWRGNRRREARFRKKAERAEKMK